MDFVPDGWLASFSEAVELYETTRFGERLTNVRRIEMSAQLRQKLFVGEIKASIQDQETGRMVPIPGQFWGSDKAKSVTNPGLSFHSNMITGFGGYGPARISREDVVKAAKQASDPPVSLTSRGAKDRAFKVARDYVLTFKGKAEQPTQKMVGEHVKKKEHSVANADPREWWKKFRDDPETRDLIKASGRPPQNPENIPK